MTISHELDALFEASLPKVASMKPHKMLPGTVYHYTAAAGLRGILMGRVMWATNFSFLNDPSELSYGQDLVLRVLRAKQDGADKVTLDLWQGIAETLRTLPISEVYVCCFTACRDDLN